MCVYDLSKTENTRFCRIWQSKPSERKREGKKQKFTKKYTNERERTDKNIYDMKK